MTVERSAGEREKKNTRDEKKVITQINGRWSQVGNGINAVVN